MPAQSPTLSPTLSAITAGFRGSSSGMPGLDLADQVGADVGGLREDAAAEPGEDRDQRTAEAEADQRIDRVVRRLAGDECENAVVAGDTEQREADDEQSGDRAAAEGDVERRRDAAARGLGDARIGADRHVHADVPGGRREQAADREPIATWMFWSGIRTMNRTTPTPAIVVY